MRTALNQHLWILLVTLFTFGCAANKPTGEFSTVNTGSTTSTISRQLAKRANIDIVVKDMQAALKSIDRLAQTQNGLVLSKHERDENYSFVNLSVPTKNLEDTLLVLGHLGLVRSSSVSSNDVTDSIIDTDAKLKNLIELRAKYRKLLDKSTSVSDLLAVEKELTRVQSEIDTLEAQHKVLNSSVAMAKIDITLNKKRVLGPLGYVGKALLWITEKLFILN